MCLALWSVALRIWVDNCMQPGIPHSPAQYMLQGAPRAGSGGSSGVEEEVVHPKSKATRRGPMDEMRQLVRPVPLPGPSTVCTPVWLGLW